jgi:hypothetical protein
LILLFIKKLLVIVRSIKAPFTVRGVREGRWASLLLYPAYLALLAWELPTLLLPRPLGWEEVRPAPLLLLAGYSLTSLARRQKGQLNTGRIENRA